MLKDALPEIVTAQLPGPKAAALLARRAKTIPSAIKCAYPVVIERGQGAMVEDVDGNRFVDWIGGVGVLNIGYSHPEVVEAVKAQADDYFHGMFNIVTHKGYVELSEKLSACTPVIGDRKKAFFANSGAEAVENAVKLAKAFTGRPNIIVFSGAFHGRTMLTMAMTAKKLYATGMGPFPDGVYRAEFPYLYRKPAGMSEQAAIPYYISKLEEVFEQCSPAQHVAALVIEPVQGEGGFIPVPLEWIKAVRSICDKHGILLIADEIQTGFGRTGRLFASEYWKEAGAMPDIVTAAKSIAAGVPLSAIIAREEIMEAAPPSTIGGTFCGNPLACAAGLKVLEIMQRDRLPDRALEIGKTVADRYLVWKEKYEAVGDVRGIGSMLGIEFVKDKAGKEPNPGLVSRLVAEAANRGLMIESAGTHNNVIRFLAPLVISDAQLKAGLDIFEASLDVLTPALEQVE